MSLSPQDGSGSEPREPVVLLPEEPTGFFGNRGPLWWIVLAMVAGGLVIGAVLLLQGGGEEVAPPPAETDGPPPHVDQLGAVMDSFRVRVQAYRDRQRRFDSGQIECDSLAAAYHEVDEAFLNVALLYRQMSVGADTGAVRRFDQLSTAADSVYRRFDGTGCQRPG